jgi:ectoine hydroxylase-related dioxygenase (phytanoyl-CoA dioxygenase family)
MPPIGQERKEKENLSQEQLNRAIEQIKNEGYVVLEDILSRELIDNLYAEYMKALNEKVTRFGLERVTPQDDRQKYNDNVGLDFRPEGGNHDLNRWNMHLPSRLPFLDYQVVAHPAVVSILEGLLGKDCCMYMLASDTPFPGSGFQNFHQDFHRLAFTINIPLVDFTEENAPLEVLPGTHRKSSPQENELVYTEEDVWLSENQLREAVKNVSARRLLVRAGSIVIRDQRLIHRGTAHYGDTPRAALSLWVKPRQGFDLSKLNTPIPHRSIANLVAKLALSMRQKGRGKGSQIQNRELVNLGNLLGRLVDELSGTDRDYRRVIPHEIWEELTPAAKHFLRYAEIDKQSDTSPSSWRSVFGSLILLAIALAALVWWLKISLTNALTAKPARSGV